MSVSNRTRALALSLAALAVTSAGCTELQQARWMENHGDVNDRVEPVGGGVLVVRPLPATTKRVGLVSLDTGERRVVELERFLEVRPGAFAGPDALGRYAYFERNNGLSRQSPSGLATLLLGPSEMERYQQSWRIKEPARKDEFEKWLFDGDPRRLVVGELGHPGERVLVEHHPADLQEKALALSPTSGALAFFAFDFDDQGKPVSLHLEVWNLAGGEPRTFPLGRPKIDVGGAFGPSLAWLADEKHLVFKRDTLAVDHGGVYEIADDWNGAGGDSTPWMPGKRGVVLMVLDTESGAVRELGPGLYAWPTNTGDDVFVSDGAATWLVHAATGEVHDRRELAKDSPLRAPKSTNPWDSHLAVIGAPAREKVLVLAEAADSAGLPREWTQILGTHPDGSALTLVAQDGGAAQVVVPALTSGWLTLSNGALPADMPLFRRSAKHERE